MIRHRHLALPPLASALLTWGLAWASTPGHASEADLMLVYHLGNSQPYVGEATTLTVTLLAGQAALRHIQYPRLASRQARLSAFTAAPPASQVRDGEEYTAYAFTARLTPLASGPLDLGPARLDLEWLRPGQGPAAIFGELEPQPLTLATPPIRLEPRPLPEAGRPAGFTGAQGRFRISRTADPGRVKVGDPVSVTTRVSGDGNLAALACPTLELPGVNSYPVRRRTSVGKFDCTQVLLPQRPGALTLPAARIHFFDPESGQYRDAQSPELRIEVEAPPPPPAQIHRGNGPGNDTRESIPPDSMKLWPWLLALAVFPPGLLYWWRRKKSGPEAPSNPARQTELTRPGFTPAGGKRQTPAGPTMQDRQAWMDKASQALADGDPARFHEALFRTLQADLALCHDVPVHAITERLLESPCPGGRHGISKEENYRALFDRCNRARYSGSWTPSRTEMEDTWKLLKTTLQSNSGR